jgi:hypothetical protein
VLDIYALTISNWPICVTQTTNFIHFYPKTEVFSGLVLLTPKPKADEGGLANQLLKSNDALIGTVNCKQREQNYNAGVKGASPNEKGPGGRRYQREQNYDAGVKGASPNEKGPGGRRYLRLSKEEFTSAALDAVMEVLKGDPMTRKLSEEMLITVDVDARRRRRNELEKLLGLIKGERWNTIYGKLCVRRFLNLIS